MGVCVCVGVSCTCLVDCNQSISHQAFGHLITYRPYLPVNRSKEGQIVMMERRNAECADFVVREFVFVVDLHSTINDS